MSRLEVADLVVIAARVLDLRPAAALDLLDLEAAEAALAEAGRWCDRDPVADARAALDEGVVADVAAGADDRARHDMGEGPHPGARADAAALAQAHGVDEHRLTGHAASGAVGTTEGIVVPSSWRSIPMPGADEGRPVR